MPNTTPALWKELVFSPHQNAKELPNSVQVDLLTKGAILSLEEDGSIGALEVLFLIATTHDDLNVQKRAFNSLANLARKGTQEAIDQLFMLAIVNLHPGAISEILNKGYRPSSESLLTFFALIPGYSSHAEPTNLLQFLYDFLALPPGKLKNQIYHLAQLNQMTHWLEILSILIPDEYGAHKDIPLITQAVKLFPQLLPIEQEAFITLLGDVAKSGNSAAKDILCQFYIEFNDQRALQICRENDFTHSDLVSRALFYFLSEEWDEYRAIDFNQKLIQTAFENGSHNIRTRLLQHSRNTGYIEWLKSANYSNAVRWINDMRSVDWDSAANYLFSSENFQDLLRLIRVAPPVNSARILSRLNNVGWKPIDLFDREQLEFLVELAKSALEAPMALRPAIFLKQPNAEATCLAVDALHKRIATGGSDSAIHLWTQKTRESDVWDSRTIYISSPQSREMQFNPTGDYLVIASGDNRIRIIRLTDGQVIKTLSSHQDMIRSLLIHPDGKVMISGGLDGIIRFWRFPFGSELHTIDLGYGQLLSMVMDYTGKYLMVSDPSGIIKIISIPEGNILRNIPSGSKIIALSAGKVSELVAAFCTDQKIRISNITSGKLVNQIDTSLEKPIFLHFAAQDNIIYIGDEYGNIHIMDSSSGQPIASTPGHHSKVIGLNTFDSEDMLISASQDGQILFWDMETLILSHLPIHTTEKNKKQVESLVIPRRGISLSENKWRLFIAKMIEWNHRYDIAISEPEMIKAGEFDIEL
ncbi:MAG TPA: hypothetical protein VIO61_11755 [Anaerolineaceae bacterium]